jgi:hypothetical protein
MKSWNAFVAGALVLLVSACDRLPADEQHVTESAPATSVEPDIAAQNRVNSVFYVALVPKIKSCWSRLTGKGDITFKYVYRRDGTNWVWQQQEIEESALPQDQNAIALQCMQEAAQGSSFPMDASEAARRSQEFVLHWTWPVPFPQDTTALGRMIDTGGGGESGCKKSCVDCPCPFVPGPGVVCSCKSTCSGYNPPCVLDTDKKGCSMKLPKCATGKLGGFGSVIIARSE